MYTSIRILPLSLSLSYTHTHTHTHTHAQYILYSLWVDVDLTVVSAFSVPPGVRTQLFLTQPSSGSASPGGRFSKVTLATSRKTRSNYKML
jgi:hypothetical protein